MRATMDSSDGHGHRGRSRRGSVTLVALVTALLAAVAPATASARGERVVGGVPTTIQSAPYQVLLWDPTDRRPIFSAQPAPSPATAGFCGGVVLDATHVATAAHCATVPATGRPRPTSSVRVMAGSPHLRGPGQALGAGERDVAVSGVTVDPAYDPRTSDSDAAVLTLTEPLYAGSPADDGSVPVAPIPLMSPKQTLAVGAPVRVTGWGDTRPRAPDEETGPLSADLLQATTHLVASAACARDYEGVDGITVTPRQICAGEPTGGIDACAGDSGGPLTGTIGGERVLVGLVDLGVGCAQARYPGVYTRAADAGTSQFLRSASGARLSTATDAPPPPPALPSRSGDGDTARPTISRPHRRCTSTRCVVTVRVTDPDPSSGIRRVRGTLRWTTRPACRRHGHRTHCARRHTRTLVAKARRGGTYTLRTPRLGRRTYRLTVTATDGAGHSQRHARRLHLRPKRR